MMKRIARYLGEAIPTVAVVFALTMIAFALLATAIFGMWGHFIAGALVVAYTVGVYLWFYRSDPGYALRVYVWMFDRSGEPPRLRTKETR